MHPEDWVLNGTMSDAPEAFWLALLVQDRRRARFRRTVSNVLATLLTTAAFATLLVLVRFVEC